MNITKDVLAPVLHKQLNEADMHGCAMTAISITGATGFLLFTLDQRYHPVNVEFCLWDGEPCEVGSFHCEFSHPQSCAIARFNALTVNGEDLLEQSSVAARIFELNIDDNAVCVALFGLPNNSNDTLVTSALKLASEQVLCAVSHYSVVSAISISDKDKMTHQLELLNEIGTISKTGGWEVDLATGKMFWTDEMYSLFGFARDKDITIDDALGAFSGESKDDILAAMRQAVIEGREYHHDSVLTRTDGSTIRVKATGKPRYRGSRVTHLFGALEDISIQQKLRETEHNYAAYLTAIVDNLNDAVISIDIDGNIITANRTMSTIFGYRPKEIIGENISVLMPEPHSSMHPNYIQHYLETGNAKIIGNNRELMAKHKSGRLFPIELSLSEVVQQGQRQFVGIVRDITKQRKAMEDIYSAAYFDALTEQPNMRSFERDITKVLGRSALGDKALDIYCCLIDMDNFTQYNLSFGKLVGDAILQELSRRLVALLPSEFSLYRGIGDNFLILSTTLLAAHSKQIHDQVNSLEWAFRKNIEQPILISGLNHSVTASISSCQIDASSATYEKVTGVLAFSKKLAKKQGLGGFVALDKAGYKEYNRYIDICNSFQSALDNNEFYLVLQPQYDKTNKIIGSEALIRWEHNVLGFISPAEFIPVAEESEAIISIGVWVLDEVCRILRKCLDKGIKTRVAVNISGRHIVRADFQETLVALTRKWSISPEQLMLEITETTLVTSIELVRQRMELLGERGFSFSIDDFGTGYSSLSYLKELPISELKIDRYFVDEIAFQVDDVPIVNSIIDLATALGVSTIAEGIEKAFQRDYLIAKGCDNFQGYFYSRPLPEQTWLDLLSYDASVSI